MDDDRDPADRAARGRRIFEALRRGRPEDDASEGTAASADTTTATAVDERPSADQEHVEEDSDEESGQSPAATPEAPTSDESDEPDESDDAPTAEPAVAEGGADESPEDPPGEPDSGSAPAASSPTAAEPPPEPGEGGPGASDQRAEEGAEDRADQRAEEGTEDRSDGGAVTEAPGAGEGTTERHADGDAEGDHAPDVGESGLPGVDALQSQLQPAPAPEEAPAAEVDDPPDSGAGSSEVEDEGDAETIPRPPPSDALPRVLAIANQKGGVGKTTTAVNLGASLSELGYRVLIVDLDPQGNATTGLGIDIRNLDGSVYESLMGDTPLEDCIEPTSVRNLFVAPSNMDLAGAEIELVPVFSRELKLRRAIEEVKDEYDFVLIDCPPSLGLLTVNGLAAADDVVVPIQCEYYALEGLGQLVNNVNLVRSNLNPVLDLRGIVLTMYDARTKLADQVVSEVRTHFGDRVYETVVPRTVRLSEAPSFGQPIIVFDSSSRGSDAYRSLAQEVAERVAGRPRDPIEQDNDRED